MANYKISVVGWRDVMTQRYDMISSHKCMIDNIFKICNQKTHGNMKTIIFLVNLQAEMMKQEAFWHHDMASWHRNIT